MYITPILHDFLNINFVSSYGTDFKSVFKITNGYETCLDFSIKKYFTLKNF